MSGFPFRLATRNNIAAVRLSGKRVPYDILHNLNSVDHLFSKQKLHVIVKGKCVGILEAERLIANQNTELQVRIRVDTHAWHT